MTRESEHADAEKLPPAPPSDHWIVPPGVVGEVAVSVTYAVTFTEAPGETLGELRETATVVGSTELALAAGPTCRGSAEALPAPAAVTPKPRRRKTTARKNALGKKKGPGGACGVSGRRGRALSGGCHATFTGASAVDS